MFGFFCFPEDAVDLGLFSLMLGRSVSNLLLLFLSNEFKATEEMILCYVLLFHTVTELKHNFRK